MRTPLHKGEKVLLVTYSSWIILVLPVLTAVIALVAAYYIGFIERYGWIVAVLGVVYLLFRYLHWRSNIWVVTNFRVIDEYGLFDHHSRESRLDKINNVNYDRPVLGHIFNYGNVVIQTAAEVGETIYKNVNRPKRLRETITEAQEEYKTWEYTNQAAHMAAALGTQVGPTAAVSAPQIAAELEKLFELKMKGAISDEEYNRAKARLLNH